MIFNVFLTRKPFGQYLRDPPWPSGYDAWLPSVSSQVRVPLDPQAGWPGRYINVWCCGGLSMVLLQLKGPLELFVKSREFLPGYGFLSLVAINLSC